MSACCSGQIFDPVFWQKASRDSESLICSPGVLQLAQILWQRHKEE